MNMNPAYDVNPAYLEAAAEAGLLYQLDRFVLVADAVTDPLTGQQQCLVEYVATRDHAGPTTDPAELRRALAEAWPECDEALVRAGALIGPPFEPYSTYVVYEPREHGTARTPETCATDGAAVIRPEADRDLATVVSMLAEAFDRGSRQHGQEPDPRQVDGAVSDILKTSGRTTLVAELAGRTVGHVTLLSDVVDDPTGAEYIELFDMLVRPLEDQQTSRQLVSAAQAFAARTGKKLLGHVIHSVDSTGHGERVLAGLQRAGWHVHHHYSYAPLRDRRTEC